MSAKVMKTSSIPSLKSAHAKAHTHSNADIKKRSVSTSSDTPSPLDFANFLPWVCLQYEMTVEVTVIKAVAAKYVSRRKPSNVPERKSAGKVSSNRLKSSERKSSSKHSEPVQEPSSTLLPSDKIPIVAYYDASGLLVEIAIVKSAVKIQQKAIKCILMCLPFHPKLLKFTITGGGLSSEVLYEVAKMLPLSFITDVSIVDCYVKEGNYYILLDNISPLKVLYLKKCMINDLVFIEIIKRLDMGQPASGLTVLDLSSNLITDRGVWYLGDVLRRNRSLLHLSLADNKITDIGTKYIMNSLKEFQMSPEEIYGMRKRRFKFVENIGISKQEKGDDIIKHDASSQVNFRGKFARKKTLKKKKQSTRDQSRVRLTSKSDTDLGSDYERREFTDVFGDHDVVIRDGTVYCIGNLTLCSLNLAYNELDYMSVKKILDAVHYQNKIAKIPPRTGLMRLVLEGNLIPKECDELHDIGLLLSFVISTAAQSARVLRSRSKF